MLERCSTFSFVSLSVLLSFVLSSCSSSSSSFTAGSGSGGSGGSTCSSSANVTEALSIPESFKDVLDMDPISPLAACTLDDNTTTTGTANTYGCYMTTRDTSACTASRTAQGLSGFWLKFSCRVTLTKTGSSVTVSTDARPDTLSQYFGASHDCYQSFTATGRTTNPNTIAAQTIAMTVPYSPTPSGSFTSTSGATIGIALNGVSIFGNFAAPGDNIYDEAATFDKCEGHPQNTGVYHYHTEPTSITQNTSTANASAFVGVMRDGYPIYGRLDSDGTTPTLDCAGGHTGKTVDSPSTSVYHYHVNYQTDGTDSAYFISKGKYYGTAGTCTGC